MQHISHKKFYLSMAATATAASVIAFSIASFVFARPSGNGHAECEAPISSVSTSVAQN